MFHPLLKALCHQTLVYCGPEAIYVFQHHHSAVHTASPQDHNAAHEDTYLKLGQFMPTFGDNSDSFLTLNPVLLCGCFHLNLLLSLFLYYLCLPLRLGEHVTDELLVSTTSLLGSVTSSACTDTNCVLKNQNHLV